MPSLADRLLEQCRREEFLRAANADFAAIKRDPEVWTEVLRERIYWDQITSDGLSEK